MKPIQHLAFVVLASAAALLSSGCANTSSYARSVTNSHFSYPNSNVKPLQPVSHAEKMNAGFFFMLPDFSFTSADEERMLQQALGQIPDANMLLDYTITFTHRSYMIPVPPIFIPVGYKSTMVEIEGVAAKAEVGTQELR